MLRIPFSSGSRIPVCRQVKHPEAIEHQSYHHPLECIFNSLFCLVPSTTYLDYRLFVEHAQLVSWNVYSPTVYLSLLRYFEYSVIRTRRIMCLHAVIVHLQCWIRSRPHESNQMIRIVVHSNVGFSNGMIVGANVVNNYYVSINLLPEKNNNSKHKLTPRLYISVTDIFLDCPIISRRFNLCQIKKNKLFFKYHIKTIWIQLKYFFSFFFFYHMKKWIFKIYVDCP